MSRHQLTWILLTGIIFGGSLYQSGASKAEEQESRELSVTIDAGTIGSPISPYIYGQFIEHLRQVISGSIWAEMLDDRKFFYPVSSAETLTPENTRRMNRWKPIGPDGFIVMDRKNAYVGKHSPHIKLEQGSLRGFLQEGLVLQKSRDYTGRIILCGDPAAMVRVSLAWGPNPEDRQTISFENLPAHFEKFPLNFTSKADAENGFLEIIGQGSGTFSVGAVSLMPAENIQGMRPDTLRLLKEIGGTVYRWPGGNFLSGYDWHHGIGDPDQRPPRYDYAWRALESNDFGLDDFIAFCRLIDTEPYIAVNSGFGDAHSAAQEVEYANGSADTPMGKWRAANGHPEPYGVKWWSIGNEMYGAWQLGFMSLRHYVIKHNMFAEAMRRVDPSIKLFACGASPDETTCTNTSRRITGKILTDPGSPADWSGGLLEHCTDHMDLLSEHFYCYWGKKFNLQTGKYDFVDEPLETYVRRLPNRVRCKVEAWEDYLERIPDLKDKNIRIAIDEWNYSQLRPFSLKGALAVAEGLHEMFRYSDLIFMAAYTMGTSNLAFNATDAVLQTNGLVFKLYRHHFGSLPVAVLGNSPQPMMEGDIGGARPRKPSGSDTFPLDIAAAWTADRKTLTVAIVNPTETAQEMTLDFQNVKPTGRGRLWRITGADKDAFNQPGKKPEVEIGEIPLKNIDKRLTIPPVCIDLYELIIEE
jgi:alpha-N-arabinofuranosidase